MFGFFSSKAENGAPAAEPEGVGFRLAGGNGLAAHTVLAVRFVAAAAAPEQCAGRPIAGIGARSNVTMAPPAGPFGADPSGTLLQLRCSVWQSLRSWSTAAEL